MSGGVVDTHALIWMLMSPARLSSAAHDWLSQAVERGDPIFVPTICLVEIAYLIEKRDRKISASKVQTIW